MKREYPTPKEQAERELRKIRFFGKYGSLLRVASSLLMVTIWGLSLFLLIRWLLIK